MGTHREYGTSIIKVQSHASLWSIMSYYMTSSEVKAITSEVTIANTKGKCRFRYHK